MRRLEFPMMRGISQGSNLLATSRQRSSNGMPPLSGATIPHAPLLGHAIITADML
jgi:hypothetical protein